MRSQPDLPKIKNILAKTEYSFRTKNTHSQEPFIYNTQPKQEQITQEYYSMFYAKADDKNKHCSAIWLIYIINIQLVYSYKCKVHFSIPFSYSNQRFLVSSMLQTNSGIDDDWIAFEPNHYSFCEKQQKVGSESTGSLGNRLAQLTSMYENLVNNSKHVISKLCFLLSKFIPHDSNIKQAFSFIQKMQEGWKHFNNRDDNCSTIVDRLQSNYKVESKKQHKFRTKLGNQQIKIQPIANASNLIKSQVSTHNFYTPLSQVRQNTMQTHSKKFIDGYSINILDSEQQTPAKSISQPHYKIKLKDEFYHIRQFVLFWLYPRLEVHQDKILQKKMIVNCYFAWNRRVKRQIQISETSKLQMELTVQIKLKVPSAESKFRIFKGVGFKEQYMRQMNITDYEPKTGGREHELCCEGNSNMGPLDEILMLARRQKKENIVPFNEQKMAALDRALGLI